MKSLWVLFLFLFSPMCFGTIANSMVASVGNLAITSYDVQRMTDFLEASASGGNKKNVSQKDVLKELIYSDALFYLSDSDPKMVVSKTEIENMISGITNNTNSNDPSSQYRQKLYQDFPEQYRNQLRKNQIMRALLFYKTELKEKSNIDITEKQEMDFYKKNLSNFIEPPSVDFILVTAPQPKNLSLDELDSFEKSLGSIAETLKKTDDISNIIAKYKKTLNLDTYSGRTGFFPINELFKNGYPEEMIMLSVMTNPIRSAKGEITIKNGTVLGPELFQFRSSKKPSYFVFKLINRKMTDVIPFAKVKQVIDYQIKESKMGELIEQYVFDKINKNELKVNILDKTYEEVYDELLRR